MTPEIRLRTVVYFAMLVIALAILYVFLSYGLAKEVATPETVFYSEPTPSGDTARY